MEREKRVKVEFSQQFTEQIFNEHKFDQTHREWMGNNETEVKIENGRYTIYEYMPVGVQETAAVKTDNKKSEGSDK